MKTLEGRSSVLSTPSTTTVRVDAPLHRRLLRISRSRSVGRTQRSVRTQRLAGFPCCGGGGDFDEETGGDVVDIAVDRDASGHEWMVPDAGHVVHDA